MRIANNIPALLTHINMRRNDRLMSASMQRLSSGLRINSAREDAAGLAIANKLSFQVTGLERASSNSTHGISMIQTAEGALNEIHNMLQRMRELSVQAANDAVTMEDREKIQSEINQLTDEITAAAGRAEFNQIKLLNGEAARVNSNWHAGRVNAVIAAATFISENVPSGTLHYTIHRVGLPAEVIGGYPIQPDHTFTDRISPARIQLDFSDPAALEVAEDSTLLINEHVLHLRAGDNIQDVLIRALEGPPAGVISGSADDTLYRGVDRITGLELIPDPDEPGVYILETTDNNTDRRINIFSDNHSIITDNLGITDWEEANADTASPARIGGSVHHVFYVDSSITNPQVPAGAGGTLTLTLPDGSTREVIINDGDYITDVLDAIRAIDLTGTNVRFLDEGSRSFAFETTESGRDQMLRLESDNVTLLNLLGIASTVAIGSSGTGARASAIGTDGTGRVTINGIQINISANDTYDSVKARIIEASHFGGFLFQEVLYRDEYGDPVQAEDEYGNPIYDEETGLPVYLRTVLLTSQIAGRAQRVEVEGDPRILQFFGLQPAYSRGTDAQISAHMVDRRGNDLRDFNQALSVTADGNNVTFLSSHGNTIHLNVQVRPNDNATGARFPREVLNNEGESFDPPRFEADPQFFAHGDGSTPVANPPATGVTDMELRIENFGPIKLQIGPNFNQNMDVQIPRVNAETLRLAEYKGGQMFRLLNVMTHTSAERAITQTNTAIEMVSRIRSRMGAYQNRLEATVRNLDTAALNTSSARSRIQDTDMAREMTMYSQRNVMFQAGIAILGQANQRPQMVLQLLN